MAKPPSPLERAARAAQEPVAWLRWRLTPALERLRWPAAQVRRRGIHWNLDPEDQFISKAIACHGMWDPRAHRTLRRHLPPGGRMLDVGANLGGTTIPLAVRRPDARFDCFEPSTAPRRLLEANVHGNGLANVAVHAFGLSNAAGGATLARNRDNSGSGTLHPHALAEVASSERVALRTLDSMAFDRVDLVKVDIQGHEWHFFDGARRTLKRHRPILYLEYCRRSLREAGADPDRFTDELQRLYPHAALAGRAAALRAAPGWDGIRALAEEAEVDLLLRP